MRKGMASSLVRDRENNQQKRILWNFKADSLGETRIMGGIRNPRLGS
jgi:hypothetical protein